MTDTLALPTLNEETTQDTVENQVTGRDLLSEFIFTSKYARYRDDLGRRETWGEAVGRVEDMHLRKYSFLSKEDEDEIRRAFDLVRAKKVLPSMRAMQFGGVAIEANNARQYNCAVRHINSIEAFAQSFWLLLSGCGVGFGISKKYLNSFPNLVKTGRSKHTHIIQDTIEGWADALKVLLECHTANNPLSGKALTFDYSLIRAKGAQLKTSGGKAPGPDGLRQSLEKIEELLDNRIGKMSTILAYDILMWAAEAVLSGGVRRAACSVMFDYEDDDMMKAKTENWFIDNPQRARSNNSVRLMRGEFSEAEFKEIFQYTQEFGEPGFVFTDNEDMLFNPCFESAMLPIDSDGNHGVQFCNLTTMNGEKITGGSEFIQAAKAASLIGTLQAGYTDFPYLGEVSENITKNEALLGVSITAMMSNPDVLLDPLCQQSATQAAVETNAIWASKLGINQAARVMALKPEGTSTLAIGSLSSGIHAAHARIMWRRVQCNKEDPVYRHFAKANPHLCEESVWSATNSDDVVRFPIELGDQVMVKSDIDSIEHLDIIKRTQKNLIAPGTTRGDLVHSISCTVIVDDWNLVATYLFDNQEHFTAVSLIAVSGDKDYQQAPNEAVSTEADELIFEMDEMALSVVDYSTMVENGDDINVESEAACVGGSCSLV